MTHCDPAQDIPMEPAPLAPDADTLALLRDAAAWCSGERAEDDSPDAPLFSCLLNQHLRVLVWPEYCLTEPQQGVLLGAVLRELRDRGIDHVIHLHDTAYCAEVLVQWSTPRTTRALPCWCQGHDATRPLLALLRAMRSAGILTTDGALQPSARRVDCDADDFPRGQTAPASVETAYRRGFYQGAAFTARHLSGAMSLRRVEDWVFGRLHRWRYKRTREALRHRGLRDVEYPPELP